VEHPVPATRNDWNIEPFVPGRPIPYAATFTSDEFDKLKEGCIPEEMEEKWFVYLEMPYLFIHRSWTGKAVYRVELDASHGSAVVREALLAAEFASNPAHDTFAVEDLDHVISYVLLGKPRPIPRHPDIPQGKRWWQFWT